MSPLRIETTRRRCLLPATSYATWTLALVFGLLSIPSKSYARYIAKSSEDKIGPPTRRCAPTPHDDLWTRLNTTASRLTVLDADDDDEEDDEEEVSEMEHLSTDNDYDVSPAATTDSPSKSDRPHWRQNRRRRRRGRWRWWRRKGWHIRRGRLGRRGRRRATSTSWSCQLRKHWKRMASNVFPAYVQTGSCRRQPTCMLGIYACRPRRYLVKVLRRVTIDDSDDGCRPVPVAGPHVVYEEAWSLDDVRVTVACECSIRRRSGAYHRKSIDNT